MYEIIVVEVDIHRAGYDVVWLWRDVQRGGRQVPVNVIGVLRVVHHGVITKPRMVIDNIAAAAGACRLGYDFVDTQSGADQVGRDRVAL